MLPPSYMVVFDIVCIMLVSPVAVTFNFYLYIHSVLSFYVYQFSLLMQYSPLPGL